MDDDVDNLIDAGSRRQRGLVLSARVDVIDWIGVLAVIGRWAQEGESRYVCLCNAHSIVSAHRDAGFREVINEADLALPDGAPVAWMLRQTGFVRQLRISGPELMWEYCRCAEVSGDSVFLYGSSPATLDALTWKLKKAFPSLQIAGAIPPPFRTLSSEEDVAIVEQINASGAGVIFVCLGCPKQEYWMAAHRGRINAVMIGVGAAFEWHAGTTKRAPKWMQDNGLEWLHRLACEPRRLWRRYFVTNTLFIVSAIKQLIGRAA